MNWFIPILIAIYIYAIVGTLAKCRGLSWSQVWMIWGLSLLLTPIVGFVCALFWRSTLDSKSGDRVIDPWVRIPPLPILIH
jgi:hypothetical protein